ncbi:hypothetical protein DSO57_1033391 [Entomophthora muscae]|uniref:Uncharacterized protein n=1 Tax=Entomophthora muscae TaxID=34485 RepID=A0ACC2UKT5_9FUNG|nr:hypothetical protein DSO57_1033391 [Entomophthora muscae]
MLSLMTLPAQKTLATLISPTTHNVRKVLEPSQFLNLIATASLYSNLDKEIQEEQPLNPPISTADLEIRNNIWYYDISLFVPQGPLRNQIIQAFHDTPLSGHGEINKNLKRIS